MVGVDLTRPTTQVPSKLRWEPQRQCRIAQVEGLRSSASQQACIGARGCEKADGQVELWISFKDVYVTYIYIYMFILIHAFDAPRQTFAVSTVCLLRRVHASMLHSPELNLKLTTSHSNNAPSTTLVTGTSEEPCT